MIVDLDERRKEQKYGEIKISMDKRDLIWKLDIKTKEKIALLFIINQSGDDGFCTASLNLIALRCGFCDRSDASKVTNSLVRKGLIKIIKNGFTPEGITKNNSYQVVLDKIIEWEGDS